MAILKRFTQLLSADLHAVLDSMADPESLLKQALRDMQAMLQRQQIVVVHYKQHQLRVAQDQKKSASSLAQIDDEIGLCFEINNAELMRGLVKNKLITQRRLALINEEMERLKIEIDRLQTAIEGNQQKFELMQQQSNDRLHRSQVDCYQQSRDQYEGGWRYESKRRTSPSWHSGIAESERGFLSDNTMCQVTDDELEMALLIEHSQRSGK